MYVRIRRTIRLSIAASMVLMNMLAPRCQASWAYVPQEIRMMGADLVVVGTIAKLGKPIERDGRTYNVGVIKPTTILKGRPKLKDDIRVAWPAPTPLMSLTVVESICVTVVLNRSATPEPN